MSKAGFGEHLKREREMRGVSLDEICAATRISTRFLGALESEQWEVLPGGVFNRGFVRAVARFLGLDEEGMVAEYAMALSEHNPAPSWSRPPAPPPTQAKNWTPWAVAFVVLLLAGAGWFGLRLRARHRAQRIAPRNASAAPLVTPSPMDALPTLPPSIPYNPAAQDTSSTSAPAANAPAVAQTTDGSLELKIEAGKPTMVAVEADGLPMFNGDIIAGQTRTFYAQTMFQVSARDAGALLLQLNGQTLAPVGPPGSPGKVILTRQNLKPTTGALH